MDGPAPAGPSDSRDAARWPGRSRDVSRRRATTLITPHPTPRTALVVVRRPPPTGVCHPHRVQLQHLGSHPVGAPRMTCPLRGCGGDNAGPTHPDAQRFPGRPPAGVYSRINVAMQLSFAKFNAHGLAGMRPCRQQEARDLLEDLELLPVGQLRQRLRDHLIRPRRRVLIAHRRRRGAVSQPSHQLGQRGPRQSRQHRIWPASLPGVTIRPNSRWAFTGRRPTVHCLIMGTIGSVLPLELLVIGRSSAVLQGDQVYGSHGNALRTDGAHSQMPCDTA